ncbi:hypothetical protein [Aureivirga sp. CE67]|uniref:hypothetical protein n=1 Tax=Aureivirga sp. CE67 TaxID=1788983 RepID=UPI0018CB67AF|nr:hypothetical protein [Aureivirga sp. CE67]
MNKITSRKGKILSLFLFLHFFCFHLSFGQMKQDEEKIKEVLKTEIQDIFKLCQKKKDAKLAAYFLYSGDDENRNRKDYLRKENKTDLESAKKNREHIFKKYVENFKNIDFQKFLSQTKRDGRVLYAWKMKINYPDTSKEVLFAFLKIKDQWVIVDID